MPLPCSSVADLTEANRLAFYKLVYFEVQQSFQANGPLQGVLFWRYTWPCIVLLTADCTAKTTPPAAAPACCVPASCARGAGGLGRRSKGLCMAELEPEAPETRAGVRVATSRAQSLKVQMSSRSLSQDGCRWDAVANVNLAAQGSPGTSAQTVDTSSDTFQQVCFFWIGHGGLLAAVPHASSHNGEIP